MREANHGVGLVWFGLALAWDEGGQPRGGLVWFGAYLGKGRPGRGQVWLCLTLIWEEEDQQGGGLVWVGAYLGLTMVAAHMKKASPEARQRKREASQRRPGLVWRLPWTHNGGGTHEKGLPGGAT
jgi:hypothetical protein